MTDTRKPHANGRRVLRWAAYAGVLPLTIAAAWFFTRGPKEPPMAEGHAGHGGGGPATTAAQPVMLTPDQARRIGVTYATVEYAPMPRDIRTVGQVTYDETKVKAVSFKIDGWVEELYVNFTGQPVSAGTPLLAIYSPMLVTAQEELLLAKKLQSDIAGGDTEARGNAESLLASARRRLAYWDIPAADVRQIESSGQVQRTLTLRSPVSGFVVEKNVLQGQRIMAGDALYRIADLSSVWVDGEVFERDLTSIRLGQQVRAEFDAMPGRFRSGRITYIYPTLNPETRTTRVRVEFENPSLQLKPGMYATLSWHGAASAVLSVPRTAVVSTGQRNLVFVLRPDGMLEPRLVQVGASTSDRTEVVSGLAAAETVVKSATFLLDAESNLATALGGMGDMPGMEVTAPKKQNETLSPKPQPQPQGHQHTPGMDMSAPKKPAEGGHNAHAGH